MYVYQEQLPNQGQESCHSYWEAAQYSFELYLLAIFSEDELIIDTLIQYCSERESQKACLHAHVRVQIKIFNFTGVYRKEWCFRIAHHITIQNSFKSQVKNSFLSITTKTLAAHNTLLTTRNYSLLIGHGIAESHPLYIYVYTAGVGVLPVTVTRNLLLAIQMLSLSAVKYSPGAIQTVALYYVTATVLSLPNIGSTHSSL